MVLPFGLCWQVHFKRIILGYEVHRMKWFFQIRPPAQVETEVTQRDQFSNDSVGLNETIVREAVQNLPLSVGISCSKVVCKASNRRHLNNSTVRC